MATISFVSPDGTESTFQLVKSRPVQIGRDPGNDLVLRDPRVSRQHAEIVFDRGFFIIRDLGSSNGTIVNGQKVRVAPLTNNAELKLGNSFGRFIDSPTEMDPTDTVSVDLFKATAVDEESDELDIRERDSLQRKVSLPAVDIPPDDEGPFPEAGPPSTMGDPEIARGGRSGTHHQSDHFLENRYLIDVAPAWGEHSMVRDARGRTLFYYHRPANVTGFIAGFVSVLIFVSGSAVAVFLLAGGTCLAAVLTAFVTVSFSLLLLLLVPRRKQVQLYRDLQGTPELALRQETQLSFPIVRFSLRDADGEVICLYSRSFSSVVGRHRWSVEEPRHGLRLARAVEGPTVAAVLRKFAGPLFGLLRTDFTLYIGDDPVGAIVRRTKLIDRIAVDLNADVRGEVDRRMAIGLAVTIDAMERK